MAPDEVPAWVFVDNEGRRSRERPRDGRPYRVEVIDPARFHEAVRSGVFYNGLGGAITDNRKTTA